MKTQTAKLNYLHIAPRKVRLLANTLKNLPTKEAEAQLLLRPQRASKPLLKLLRSAVADAKNNQKFNPDKLVISSIKVDGGPILKRALPRAMGRMTPLHKKMSHVTLILEESQKQIEPRFTITPPPKKEKKPRKDKKEKISKPKLPEAKAEKPKAKVGFFKRIFRRKSV